MHPDFVRTMNRLLGSEAEAFFAALEERPALALRVNALKGDMLPFARDFVETPVPWHPNGWYLKPDVQPGKALAHALGAYYLQEASAMVSAQALDVQPGEKILDLCAAPGGKSGQIATALQGRGVLVSNEIVESRARILAENLETLGAANAVAVNAHPEKLARKWENAFDAVLVDAPCSGEGMFRREVHARDEWQSASPIGCHRRQTEILESAAKLVRPGGRLVYSTCTFNDVENEGTIAAFLAVHPDFVAEDFFLQGIGNSADGMIRVWPQRVRGDGHFCAKLRRKGEVESKKKKTPKRVSSAAEDPTIKQAMERLAREVCTLEEGLTAWKRVRFGDYVHLLPPETPDLDGIRIVKPGLTLMRVGRSHVQPLPALAHVCGAFATAVQQREVTVEEARAFLRGEKLEAEERKRTWTLLTWRGLGVGWQKL